MLCWYGFVGAKQGVSASPGSGDNGNSDGDCSDVCRGEARPYLLRPVPVIMAAMMAIPARAKQVNLLLRPYGKR